MRLPGIIIVTLILLLTVSGVFYTVPEGTEVLITQFGEIRGEPVTRTGLHLKLPFVQEARSFDTRILSWDGDKEQIPTRDKKYIWVDATARWRIANVRKFAEAVQTEAGARARLDGILDGAARDVISNHNLVEVVRNSNAIFDTIAARKKEVERLRLEKASSGGPADSATAATIEEEVTGEIERISKGREQLSKLINERARKELEPFGIEVIDVQLRRIAYEKGVEDKVYDRMISERNRIAEKIRSIGKGEDAKIRGTLNRDLKQIESDAYRRSQQIKGVAEAKATAIYAGSMKDDPEFYEFTRTLEAYKKALGEKTQFVLSTDGDFLRYLQKRPKD